MVQINNGAGAWLVSVPQTSDAISHTGLTLVKKAQAVGTITLDFPVGSESGDTEYAEMTLGNGVTMKIATRTTAVDSSGNAMAASTSDAFPSVTVEIFDNDTTFIKALNDIGEQSRSPRCASWGIKRRWVLLHPRTYRIQHLRAKGRQ